jgi:PhnB protein
MERTAPMLARTRCASARAFARHTRINDATICERRKALTSSTVRAGFQTVVPYLAIQGAAKLVDFLGAAFGAQETFRAPSGTHFEVKIGDSMVMIGDVGVGSPKNAQLFMYVEDAESHYRRALQAGATSVLEPCDRPWGEGGHQMRGAGVKDPSGNLWFRAGPK